MGSIALFTGEEADVCPVEDDCRAIRRACTTPQSWQDQVLKSLVDSGWTLSMLVWLPATDMLYWFELLTSERDRRRALFDSSFEVENLGSEQAVQLCGDDPEKWFRLALQVLSQRGWTRTMLSDAFGEPRTNIIRRLEKCESATRAGKTAV
jgi:hypothetical protein